MSQVPKILLDGKAGKVWCVTQYLDIGNDQFKSLEKHDVSDQLNAALDKVYITALKQAGMGIAVEKRIRFCTVINSQYREEYKEISAAFDKDFIMIESEFDCSLSETQKRKLELADMVYVINNGGYISPEAAEQIRYALIYKKYIQFAFPDLNSLDDYLPDEEPPQTKTSTIIM